MIKLNYTFKNKALLDLALTQSGVNANKNNERLEFIGDRVLGLTIALLLYDMYPNDKEGGLARRHATLVSAETLAKIALELGLEHKVHHGHMTSGKLENVLADAMEAVLGAIFLDAGFSTVQQIIIDLWKDLAAAEIIAPKDSKTALQEYVQKQDSGALPVYEYTSQTGNAHNPTFNVSVSAMGQTATGTGSSKKAASLDAADKLKK